MNPTETATLTSWLPTISYETLVTPAMWLTAIAATLLLFWRVRAARRADQPEVARQRLKLALGAATIALLVVPSIAVVPGGYRGVVYGAGSGVSPTERPEGVAILIPWAQHLIPVSVRTNKLFTDQAYAQSADLQEITVVASVNYHVEPDRAAELSQRVGLQYEETVVKPALFQRVKEEVGKVKAVDFAVNRGALAEKIRTSLRSQLDEYGIVVEYVNIEDAVFDPAFIGAVKAKVTADEIAEEQERLVEAEAAKKKQAILQAEARAESIRIEADAQAEANREVAASLTPDLLEWQLLSRWNGQLPTTLLGDGDAVSFLLEAE